MRRRAQARRNATPERGAAERPGAPRRSEPPCPMKIVRPWVEKSRAASGGGFTLIEVMIALGVTAVMLGVFVGIASRSVRSANRARALTVATELARGKMLDIEEMLAQDGFQETAETLDGDFGEEGFREVEWEALIEKVELPEVDDMAAAAGEKAAGKEGESAPMDPASSPLASMLDPSGTGTGALGASMFASSFGMIKGVLENAIRKVTLTVSWKVGNSPESFQVICYFTDPKAVDQAMPGGGQ